MNQLINQRNLYFQGADHASLRLTKYFFKSTSRLFVVMYILQSQTIIVMEKYDVLVSKSNHNDLIS